VKLGERFNERESHPEPASPESRLRLLEWFENALEYARFDAYPGVTHP
jgi:hypothetical protein